LYQDGAVIKNRDVGDWSGRLPGVDSVEELRVETSMSSAQFNRPGSVILSTKSGTNTVHGSAFETNRNSDMGVARRRQDFYTKPPHYVRNEFGVSFGGPVYIPKVYNGKNKTFFFVSYEALRTRSASTSSTTVQTDAMRNGDYSGMVDAQGRLTTIYDLDRQTLSAAALISRGVSVASARKKSVLLFSILMTSAIPAVLVSNVFVSIALISVATVGYTGALANMLAMPADRFPKSTVGSVWGIASMGAGFGGMVFSLVTGWVVDHYSFVPVFVGFGILPLIAALIVWFLPEARQWNSDEALGEANE